MSFDLLIMSGEIVGSEVDTKGRYRGQGVAFVRSDNVILLHACLLLNGSCGIQWSHLLNFMPKYFIDSNVV